MLNLSFEKVLSLSKKYATVGDTYSWSRIEFLTQIVSDIIRAQGTPHEIHIKAETLNSQEIQEIAKGVFEDLEIELKSITAGHGNAYFLLK